MVAIVPLAQVPEAAVEALLDRAFEPGRHARVSYRIRAGMQPIVPLCFGALDGAGVDGGRLVGSIQGWPASLVDASGHGWPLVMVGPVAVDPACQRGGIGRQLMTRLLTAASGTGLDRAMVLIGDPEYYGRFFGFTAERTGEWSVPGPVPPSFEQRRVLSRGPDVPAVAGSLGPRLPAPLIADAR